MPSSSSSPPATTSALRTPEPRSNDSDANTVTGRTVVTNLVAGENDLSWDAGLYELASLGDYVWYDTNANGIQDGAEAGVVGVTVNLLDGSGNVIDTTTTNASGYYLFSNLTPGDYAVEFVKPSGYYFSPQNTGTALNDSDANTVTGRTVVTNLVAGENDLSWDAGLYELASLGDYVWYDTNANGIQDGTEAGVVGVTVNLLDGSGNVIDTTTTNASGYYLFSNLTPGDYAVEFVKPSGYYFSPQNTGTALNDSDANTVTGRTVVTNLVAGENDLSWDAGLYELASLGDYVWYDTNANGIQDGTEAGVVGVTVNLLDGSGNVIDTTTTNASGYYLFSNLTPGDYAVEFVKPSGYYFSPQNTGTALNDSDANTVTGRTVVTNLVAGENDLSWDAGLYELASLGDYVWYDTNANGIQDGTEAGVVGVTVNLLDGSGNVIDTTTTNASGYYLFSNLTPGDYAVEFVKPSGYYFSPQNTGTALNDSDANTVTGRTVVTNLVAGENDLSWDAGLYQGNSISGTKFKDITGNGISSDDTGLGGVTIKLYRDSNNNGVLDLSGPGADQYVTSTVTAANGGYSFNGLLSGTYFVKEVVPTGWVQTFRTPRDYYTVVTTGATQSTGNDFSNYEMVCDTSCVPSYKFYINGCATPVNDLRGKVRQGDVVTVEFTLCYCHPEGVQLTLVSYTAPGATFSDTTASQQEIYDVATGVYMPGQTGRLTVVVPNCYFQVDFVCGPAIDVFGPNWSSNIFYSSQKRLISADNGGTRSCDDCGSSIAGYVYCDGNNNGIKESGENGIAGVTVVLTGKDYKGNSVYLEAVTGADGSYKFSNLAASNAAGYKVKEIQPSGYFDGKDKIGSVSGVTANDEFSGIVLGMGVNSTNNNFGELGPSSVSGYVYVDMDNDGVKDSNEAGIEGVQVTLTGVDYLGNVVSITVETNEDGFYKFDNLRASNSNGYTIIESTPDGYTDGKEKVGSAGGCIVSNDKIGSVVVGGCTAATGYNFGERVTYVDCGDTATIGFWQNKNGQALLKCLNGSSNSKALGNWLANNFSNLFGCLAGKTNTQVASYFTTLFNKTSGTAPKTEAQIMAVALAVYVTDVDLAGGYYGEKYGFDVDGVGVGASYFNVGSNGSALGVANNTIMSVLQLLELADDRASNGTIYTSNSSMRSKINSLFTAINEEGDI
ncbi:MAG: SdrD B-like domain-containing protein [Planctomycetota bacterium]